ncbi:ADP-ribosylation/crystallin J1 [Chitinophagales bacterium]|nr:ADP-ribosylation/crystallin J1 [Chitinophagales bacterium]
MKLLTLYRQVNKAELDLIAALNWKAFPPRLPEQPFFYPVMNQQYAEEITVKWNVPAYGMGYVLKWEMSRDYLLQFKVENVGGPQHNELWVPAEDLAEFNANIQGEISLIGEFGLDD